MLQNIIKILKDIPGYWWTWNGQPTYSGKGSPDEIEQEQTLERYFDISLSPLGFAGLRYRDISRLWVSATGIDNTDKDGGGYHPPQVIYQHENEGEQEHIDYLRWVYDHAFHGKGMRVILSQMRRSLLSYGRCVDGLPWIRSSDTPFGDRVYPSDILDLNPSFYLKNPKDRPPGIYRKATLYDTSEIKRLPDTQYVWGTTNQYFENPYGISELRILNTIEKLWRLNLKFWMKGNERQGAGVLIGKYGNQSKGKNREEDRKLFFEQLQKLKSDTILMCHVDNLVEILETSIEGDSFRDAHEALGQLYSVVLAGSSGALVEGAYGSYGREESSVVRQASALQRMDASLIDDILSYQLNVWILDKNYPNVKVYPRTQIIEPELYNPTESKDEEKQERKESPQEFIRLHARKTLPDAYDREIIDSAKDILRDMPAVTRRQFDDLSDAQKRKSFTISAMKSTSQSIERIVTLKNLIIDTLDIRDENIAWDQYWAKAKQYLSAEEVATNKQDLFVSFRYARQFAFTQAMDSAINLGRLGDLTAIKIETAEDSDVRASHRRWQGVTLRPNHPIWRQVFLPWDHNCRCLKIPLTEEDVRITPDDKVPAIPEGF